MGRNCWLLFYRPKGIAIDIWKHANVEMGILLLEKELNQEDL